MGYRVGIGGQGSATLTAASAKKNGLRANAAAEEESRFLTSYSATISRSLAVRGLADSPGKTRVGGVGGAIQRAGARTINPMLAARASPFAAGPGQGLRKSCSDTVLAVGMQTPSSSRSGRSSVPSSSPYVPFATVGGTKKMDKEARRKTLELLADPDLGGVAQDIFLAHDFSGDGKIELPELLGVLQTLHRELDLPEPSQKVSESLFKKYDVNDDKSLAFQEFMELFKAMLRRSAFDRSTTLSREFFVNKNRGNVWKVFSKKKELGAGTFGTAYLARVRDTGEERVVKAVKKSRANLPLDDIEQEILIMRQVDHPHVVRLFEWYEDAGNIYLVLEALKGGTLKDVVLKLQGANKGLKEAWIRKVICQTLEGMTYCHSLRLIHKDLKDENIMLLKKDPNFEEPFAVIIDLGIAEMFSVADPNGRIMGGTPMTMAPEVWAGTFGPKCDVFSIGCILYELLSGSYPFMASSTTAQAWTRLHRRGPDWSKIKSSKHGKDLCKTMLAYKEDDRPTMRECCDHQWFIADKSELTLIPPAQFAHFAALCHQQQVKRMLLMEIASRLPMDKATEVVQIFKSLDTDKSGSLSPAEFAVYFQRMGIDDAKLAAETFKALDADSDGALTFTEFASGALLLFQDKLEDCLHSIFKHYDSSGDGTLDREEASQFLDAAFRGMAVMGVQSDAHKFLDQVLQERGGRIAFEDLKDYILGGCAMPSPCVSSARSSARRSVPSSRFTP